MPKQWISTKEAAKLLGVSQRTIQNWVDDGKLSASLTAGGHRRIDPKVIQTLLPQNQPVTTNTLPRSSDVISAEDNNENVLRVLVVEDDALLLRLYSLRFAEFSIPHRLYQAQNSLQGMYMTGRYLPQLILTDLSLPQIGGLEMIREVIKIPEMQQTKIVVVTGMETKDIMKMGKIPEGIQVLPKPIPFNTVETILYQQANALNIPFLHNQEIHDSEQH